MVTNMKDLSYEGRLKDLKLLSLRYRRLREDMIGSYKMLKEFYDEKVTSNILEMDSATYLTRRHTLKLMTSRCRLDIFSQTLE